MVVSKQEVVEWEVKSNDQPQDQEQKEVESTSLKKTRLIKVKQSLFFPIMVNVLILVSSIAVIALFVMIGGFLSNSLLIFSILTVVMLFLLMEVLKLMEKEKEANSKKNNVEEN